MNIYTFLALKALIRYYSYAIDGRPGHFSTSLPMVCWLLCAAIASMYYEHFWRRKKTFKVIVLYLKCTYQYTDIVFTIYRLLKCISLSKFVTCITVGAFVWIIIVKKVSLHLKHEWHYTWWLCNTNNVWYTLTEYAKYTVRKYSKQSKIFNCLE